jgi:putative ABC transport system ATP-binding protein
MALFDELHERGNTIVLVTHEPDIAEYAHRVVTIRDGVIASDHPSLRHASGAARSGGGSKQTHAI